MKKFLALLTLLLFVLLLYFSWQWYKKTVVCCEEPVVEEVAVVRGPLAFDCNSDNPITSEAWPQKKEEILAALAEGKKLLIVAPYFEGEDAQLGQARAEKVKALFLDKLATEQFELESWLAGACANAGDEAFTNTKFKWVVRNENVVEKHDKAIIYFEYNKTKEINEKNVVDYLDTLGEDLKKSGATVSITGHTDKDGDVDYNYKLGLERAEKVKAQLVSRGVAPEKITVDSKGELERITDGSTPELKQQNRRVEIVVK